MSVSIINLNDSNFNQFLTDNYDKITLICFSSNHVDNYQDTMSILVNLSQRFHDQKVQIAEVKEDEGSKIHSELLINVYPTFILFKQGLENLRYEGKRDERFLEDLIVGKPIEEPPLTLEDKKKIKKHYESVLNYLLDSDVRGIEAVQEAERQNRIFKALIKDVKILMKKTNMTEKEAFIQVSDEYEKKEAEAKKIDIQTRLALLDKWQKEKENF